MGNELKGQGKISMKRKSKMCPMFVSVLWQRESATGDWVMHQITIGDLNHQTGDDEMLTQHALNIPVPRRERAAGDYSHWDTIPNPYSIYHRQ